MSAALVDVIAAAADLGEPVAAPERQESTRRLAVAAHRDWDRVRRALHDRADLPEPGVDMERVAREARIAGRRETVRRVLLLVAVGFLAVRKPVEPAAWLAGLAALFTVELAFRTARDRYVRARLAPAELTPAEPPARAVEPSGGAGEAVLVGSPRAPFPGTGDEVDAVTIALDLGRPRDPGRAPRHLRIVDLESEVTVAVRRLWLARLEVSERRYAERPRGRARRFLVLELPVEDEGGLLTVLVRFARHGDALLVEARFRFLPPVSRAYRVDDPQHPRREGDGLASDIAVSLWRSLFSWLGALGWIGSGVIRPAIAAIRRRDGVQERSLRERFACRCPAPALETEVRQMASVLRSRLLDGLEESLARRGICPGPVRACAIRGDVTVAEERPARAPRARRPAALRNRRLHPRALP